MKKIYQLIILAVFVPILSIAQPYPPVGINIGTLTTGTTGTVNVPVTAGANFQNITQLSGTFTYNPAVISWNSMQNWGLTNLPGATFTNTSPGIITFTWMSLITVGPTLSAGTLIFNLQFNIIGASGTSSPIGFIATPQALSWQNGFGWSGNNFTVINGLVNIGCAGTNPTFNTIPNFYNVDFVDGSTGATSWAWTLGDGNTATTQNVNHTYAMPGTYTVCLTATNACGAATACQSVPVCANIPVVGFTFIQNGLTVVFTDGTTGSPTTRLWNFNDGTTGSSTGTFIHTFPAPGTYNVCLTATNGCGTDSQCQAIIVVCSAPLASYTHTGTNFTYAFASTSTSTLTWAWDFGDGSTSTLQNPTHTYASNGTYNVCLVATNTCGTNSTCQPILVSCPTPGAAWSVLSTNLAATFTDATATTPTSWAWDFGDGTTSTLQNPVHSYTSSGAYIVCLTTTNACGSDSTCNPVIITVAGLEDINNQYFEIYPNPAQDYVQINSSITEEMNVNFYDLQGNLMHNTTIVNGQKINTHEWAKGAYLVVVSNKTSTYNQRLIIE